MILGAGILQIPLIEQVKKSGYRTIVVSPDRDEPGACLADCFLCADVRDEKTILKYAEESRISAITAYIKANEIWTPQRRCSRPRYSSRFASVCRRY
jgi:phosphoribosylaminoimidazole carboxylase (NCAIR synthetase)